MKEVPYVLRSISSPSQINAVCNFVTEANGSISLSHIEIQFWTNVNEFSCGRDEFYLLHLHVTRQCSAGVKVLDRS